MPDFLSILRHFIPAALLASCAGHPPGGDHRVSPVRPAEPASSPLNIQAKQPRGAHVADRLTGDYAGYAALQSFIDRMVERHAFPRAYLLGLFSEARRKQWTLNYLAHESPPTTHHASSPRPGSWPRYRAQFLTEFHINRGVQFWHHHAGALSTASARFGVPAEIIMGILGVETAYGANLGKDRILDALTTLAFDYPRRADYFTDELENFLLMTRSEGMDPVAPKGSYAGAMGLGQFMPGSFLKWAEDLDGDGRKDLWNPADAIGSVARYFAENGWKSGQPVISPARVTGSRYKLLEYGYDKAYPLATLAEYGIVPATPAPVGPASGGLRFLRLGLHGGEEHWLGHDNFYVITRYNHSTHYAMAVYQLAEAVRARYRM